MAVLQKQFTELIYQHQKIINSLSAFYFQNQEDQYDIRQDIILQLWKAYPNFRGDAKVSTWIYRVSLNTILNKKRKEKKWSTQIPLENLACKPSFDYASDDDVQQLKQLINALEGKNKALVILYLEGYKYKEIATILETTESNIGTRFSRIVKKLRKKFKKENYEN